MEDLAARFGVTDLADRQAAVEARIRSVLISGGTDLGIPSWRVANAGGKRLRPLFTIVCAELAGVFDQRVVDGAAAIELVQVGSLIHDDLFDAAQTRRGASTINAVEGSSHALLAGNWVLAAASELAIGVNAASASLIAETVARLCVGQMVEFQELFNLDRSVDSHMGSIRGKTAALFEAACRMGAICADLEPPQADAAARFGDAFGMSFQVMDDLLDILGDPVKLGKPVGVDLLAGVYTLPLLTALRGPHGDEVRVSLGRRHEIDVEATLDVVARSDGVATARALIDQQNEVARAAARQLPPGPVSAGMQAFPADYARWAFETLTLVQ
jgi:geranylgeranyl pyrophosphate synthase